MQQKRVGLILVGVAAVSVFSGCQKPRNLTVREVQALRCAFRLEQETNRIDRRKLKQAQERGYFELSDLQIENFDAPNGASKMTEHQCQAGPKRIPLNITLSPDKRSFEMGCTNPAHQSAGLEVGYPRFFYPDGVFLSSDKIRKLPTGFPLADITFSKILSVGATENGDIRVKFEMPGPDSIIAYCEKNFPPSPLATPKGRDRSFSAEKFRGCDKVMVQLDSQNKVFEVIYFPSELED